MKNDRTLTLDLPLPHPDNLLEDDVVRLRETIVTLDECMAAERGSLTTLTDAHNALASVVAANAAQSTARIEALITPGVASDKTWSSERIAAEIGRGEETRYYYEPATGNLSGVVEKLPGGQRTTAYTYVGDTLVSMTESYAGITRTTIYEYTAGELTRNTTTEHSDG